MGCSRDRLLKYSFYALQCLLTELKLMFVSVMDS